MRYYGFGCYYLSSLQQGLQAAHVVGELWSKWDKDSPQYKKGRKWAKKHKTMVLLNGGNSGDLKELFKKFKGWQKAGMDLAFAKFNEDEVSLNCALTAIGIVLPKKYYNAMSALRSGSVEAVFVGEWQEWEKNLVVTLKDYRLAN
jgi:hypothetical protein